MIESTKTESRQTLDEFVEAMLAIAHEVRDNPEALLSAPHATTVRHLDEVKAARQLLVTLAGCQIPKVERTGIGITQDPKGSQLRQQRRPRVPARRELGKRHR